MRLWKRLVSLLIAAALVLALPSVSLAQLRGSYPPGFAALESGSQGPPAIDVLLPVFAYTANDIKDDQGHSLARSPRVTSVLVAPSVSWVTNVKVLGANLGGMVMPLPFIKNSIEGRSLAVAGTFTYSDIFVEPIQLGWHPKGADVLAAYSAAVPTGRYALGALDNGGLGQWGHFFQAGTTVQLDRKEPVEFSLLTTYGIHTRKRGTDITVGNIVTLEGGLGYALYKKQKMKHPIPIDVGVVYYAQFKVTPDKVNGAQRPVIQNLLAGHKDRVYGLGGELDYFIPKAGLVVGAHVLGELGARNRTQGVTGMFTIAYQVKSLVKQPPPSPEVAPDRKHGSADTMADPPLRFPAGVSR